jgi:hypothetical protein
LGGTRALTSIEIDWGGMRVTEVFPSRIPDLWSGRPVVITGRLEGDVASVARLVGRIGGERVSFEVPISADGTVRRPAIAQVWARMQMPISRKVDGRRTPPRSPRDQVRSAQLLGPVQVHRVRRRGREPRDRGRSRHHRGPAWVPVPDGVRYETTVAGPRQRRRVQSDPIPFSHPVLVVHLRVLRGGIVSPPVLDGCGRRRSGLRGTVAHRRSRSARIAAM